MKTLAIIFFIVNGLMLASYSQNDSLKKEILGYHDPKSEIIEKGRQMILDKFVLKDKVKVKEIFNYLTTEIEDEDYVALYQGEKILLFYWTEQYDKILNGQIISDSLNRVDFYRKILPKEDLLFLKLKQQLSDQRIYIYYQIQQSANINEEDKSFLKLNFNNFVKGLNYAEYTQEMDSINQNATNFLRLYPHSRYNKLVRGFIRIGYKPSNWALGYEFFSGYGILTGNLEKKFTNNIPIGFGVDIYNKNVVLYLRIYSGFNNTKDSIPFLSGTWKKNAQARVNMLESTIGYVCYNSKRFKLTPFLGISSTSISPTDNDKNKFTEYEDVGLNFTITYTLGFNMDIRLTKSKTLNITNNPDHHYTFIRLRYAFNMPQFDNKYSEFDGYMHNITIGIGLFERSYRHRM